MLANLIVGILCTGALTELIRHDGRLAEWRAKLLTTQGFINSVVSCGYCLSHWMALLTSFVLITPYVVCPGFIVCQLLYMLAFALACTRGANLVNDTLKKYNKTPQAQERSTNGTV